VSIDVSSGYSVEAVHKSGEHFVCFWH